MADSTNPEPSLPSPSATPSPPKPSHSGGWWTLLIWLSLALLLRWQVLEPRWIPSGSMLPTLQLQDRILVEKVQPRLDRLRQAPLPLNSVVVFRPPERLVASGYEPNTALIKRVVGLPGDRIEVHDGQLIRNGSAVAEAWLDETINYEMDAFTIADHQLWVLGDNRNASLDSHLWGPLPQKNVIGTAIWRYWPLQRFGSIRYSSRSNTDLQEQAAIKSMR
ncbi:MAG: signal peptidase I [Prochlorococcus sp.]